MTQVAPTGTAHSGAPLSTTKFSELGLADPFLKAAAAEGYEVATPIQAKAIPVVLEGRDLIGCAQTGTGKTAAFTLPMLDRLMQNRPAHQPAAAPPQRHPQDTRRVKGDNPNPRPIRALVLSPTRELAAQIGDSLAKYGKFTPLRQTVVFGGVSQHSQTKALRHGVDALVATPGRLLDLMDQGFIDLSKIEVLVFDEADQMLDMGFLPALKRIVAAVPKRRQTLMFSATMPDEIRKLAQQWLTNPESLEMGVVARPAERIAQSVHLVDAKKKPDLLTRFLKETARSRTLVFSRTKHGADKIVKRLTQEGLHAAAIHGNKSQGARTRTLAQFKGKNPPVLVATDLAARGLDVDDISHVVNYDLPDTPETYVHRIGRTARAGAEGIAVSFCAGDERGLLRQIERLTNLTISVEPTIDGFEPTDPISHVSPNARGRQNAGKGGGGPRRFGAKPGGGSGYAGARTSGSGGGSYGKKKAAGGVSPAGMASKRRPRRRPTAG
ncbi:ATP-dependent RNA helicase RhlE [Pirellulimonas nuda]|uniref:ATP-dependent RNA helicase RhlE n=1 Tax=Pirellulimonas nuda TaxID=2528009 RepID=A0A518DGY2_9BACT|nr:DEAD/DEAH box helicase [Pirellulimonas nuda]QDU90740.1 ATP-dependent RNA helicase RhlE [Pirellulimonas nuda]